MKRLLLPLLAAFALPTAVEANWFGKYGSKMEALNSCRNWKTQGGSYQFKATIEVDWHALYGSEYKDTLIKQDLRICRLEEVTRQVMGMETKGKKGKIYEYDQKPNIDFKVKKRFRY